MIIVHKLVFCLYCSDVYGLAYIL